MKSSENKFLGRDLSRSLELGVGGPWPIEIVMRALYTFIMLSYAGSDNPLKTLRRLLPQWSWVFVSPNKPFEGEFHPKLVDASYVLVMDEVLVGISCPSCHQRFIVALDPAVMEDSEIMALVPVALYKFIEIEL